MTEMIRSMSEVLDVMRKRRDELGITHETLDAIAGWPAGYASKLLAPEPIKNLGWVSFGLGLGALGIALVVVEDEDQAKQVRSRWIPRERAQRTASIAASMPNEVPAIIQVTPELQRKLVDFDHMKRIAKLGAKRRNKVMKKRARQRAAAHAARIRWAKERATV